MLDTVLNALQIFSLHNNFKNRFSYFLYCPWPMDGRDWIKSNPHPRPKLENKIIGKFKIIYDFITQIEQRFSWVSSCRSYAYA